MQQWQRHQEPFFRGATIITPNTQSNSTLVPTTTPNPYPSAPPLPLSPPPPPSKSPPPPPPAPPKPARRPSFRERLRTSFPGLAARLSGSSRGSEGGNRVDPVLPRTQGHVRTRGPTHPPPVFFNSDDMLAPRRRPRPRSTQPRLAPLGLPLSPPPTQPLPLTPTSAAAMAEAVSPSLKMRLGSRRAKRKVRPLPQPPLPKSPPLPSPPPSSLPSSLPSSETEPILLRPNRLGEPGVPSHQGEEDNHHWSQQPLMQEAMLVGPHGRWMERGPDGNSSARLPPPYPVPAYGTHSRPS